MPRRLAPVELAEAMDALRDTYQQLKLLLQGHLGPNNRKQLEQMRRALLPLLRRHYGKRL